MALCCLQIGNYLSLVDGRQSLDCFQFDQQLLSDHKIYTSLADRMSLVIYCDRLLAFEGNLTKAEFYG